MALIVSSLENDLLIGFRSMTNGDDKIFSEKVSIAVDKYAESGSIITNDAGTVLTGAFTGTATGKITCDDSICEGIVYAACVAMRNMTVGGNEYLAAQLASGIHTMILAGVVETDVEGTLTTLSGAASPISGKAKGTMTGIPSPMQAAFLSAFLTMNGIFEGGDEYMARQCTAAVDAYLKAAAVETEGIGPLKNSIGVGNMY